ncbi:AAA family ATPase [Flexibacterium corallicola]|uniref:AAA family ATPase n=1 Tax=Flexibacterium corallicola TaxID=3037259 RepID=UPI00286F7ED0|nr:AAA family ATPase [Pseudovibrio sp. M1P-2-3]
MCDHMVVVTRGPGSGKTSLIKTLGQRGIYSMPEAGRSIIRDQIKINGHALPWSNPSLFAELMLGWELRSYHQALTMTGFVVMDRGIPDTIGFLRICGLPVPDHIWQAARLFPYNKRVFLAPSWEVIYTQDDERKQTWKEAVDTKKAMEKTYRQLGYEIIELPLSGLEERADFVVAQLENQA